MRQELKVIPVPGVGAEDVLVDADGVVWTGTEDGSIFRVDPDTGSAERIGTTEG
jgi:streptogramin lyase